ncbi:PREDICTED: zinc finger protein 277 [Gekko japonicus]|uniref:Zinc finger protein 277 n=1 Tax=Gekko japonicus TaxID=146911 RepID=A0ABM1KB47_GEKJA|nr:PREDICTED: zinc finger protein 277 [Gekko japonicus]
MASLSVETLRLQLQLKQAELELEKVRLQKEKEEREKAAQKELERRIKEDASTEEVRINFDSMISSNLDYFPRNYAAQTSEQQHQQLEPNTTGKTEEMAFPQPLETYLFCLLRYALYWKKRFSEQPITDFCCVIRTNSKAPLEEQDNYFLLCDALPEDRTLREKLQQQRLREVLEQQQRERYDTDFCGTCMFCDKEFTGNRSVLLNHMANDHAFNIGLPDNIVNWKEFFGVLQKKIDSLQCLYCEKIFRDKNTLKDHMRKKQHRKINAKNKEYDRFYIINYLEFGKSWEEVQSEDDRELLDNQEEDWSDWEEHPVCAVCFFCEKQTDTTEKLYVHMEEAHGFDLLKIKSDYGLNFYQQVKLVNFIRREVHQGRCYSCQNTFQSKKELTSHMEETKHITFLPDRSIWDQPQYYFPTYENDTLLCTLSDSDDESMAGKRKEDVPVISEDISNIEALKQSSVLNQLREEMNNGEP